MRIKIMKVPSNLIEKDFPEYIKKKGYKCLKIKSGNVNGVKKKIGINFNYGKGMPDFLVYDDQESFLCEFKSQNDALSLSQINWVLINSQIPLCWAIALEKDEINESNFIEIDDDIERQFEIVNYAWKLKNDYLEKYVSKNPKLVGKSLFDNKYGGYYGLIPIEVNIIWNKIDKSIFKPKLHKSPLQVKK